MKERDRRAVVFGGALVALAWLGLRGVPGLLDSLQNLETSTRHQAELLRDTRLQLAVLPELSDSIGRLATIADSLPKMLLTGPDAETAKRDLMTRVRGLIDDDRLRVQEFIEGETDESLGPLTRVEIVVNVESDFRGLLDLVHALEAEGALAIDDIRIEGNPGGGLDPDIEVLGASFSIIGWFSDPATEAEIESVPDSEDA